MNAPGCNTMPSLPRLLFQRADTYALRKGEPGFWDGKQFHPCDTLESIFGQARERGYRTYMLGWYHPYPDLIGQQADWVWTTRYTDWIGTSTTDQLRQICYEAPYKLFGHRALRTIYPRSPDIKNASMVRNTRIMLDHLETILEDPASGQFVLAHLPLPHFPFAHDRNGAKPLNVHYHKSSLGGYEDHLQYTDKVLGRLLLRLRRSGKFDRSTIVITSDHNYRFNPDLPRNSGALWSHVPLLIKYPGQTRRFDVQAPFSTTRLIRLLSTARSPSAVAGVIRGGAYHLPVPDAEARLSNIRPMIR